MLYVLIKVLLCNLVVLDLGVGIVVYLLFVVYWFVVIFNNIWVFCIVFDLYVIVVYIMGLVFLYIMIVIFLDKYYVFVFRLRYY